MHVRTRLKSKVWSIKLQTTGKMIMSSNNVNIVSCHEITATCSNASHGTQLICLVPKYLCNSVVIFSKRNRAGSMWCICAWNKSCDKAMRGKNTVNVWHHGIAWMHYYTWLGIPFVMLVKKKIKERNYRDNNHVLNIRYQWDVTANWPL